MKSYLGIIAVTAVATFGFAWAAWKIGMRYRIYPPIRERDVHSTPKPRLGGVGMYLGVLVAFAVASRIPFLDVVWQRPNVTWSILAAATLIVVVGVADDLWDLDWMIKIGAQFLAAGIVVGFGGIQIYAIPIGTQIVISSWVSFGLSVFAIVTVMNAVNFIDGLDGLVASVALIANGVFFIYTYLVYRDLQSVTYANLSTFLAATMIGICIGFLPLNWNPSKLFMGDSGALLLGLLMGTAAIHITGSLDPGLLGDNDVFGRSQLLGAFIPILLPIVIVFLPLLDLVMAVVRRVAQGKSPFAPDRRHLHHRMLDMGHSDRGAVLVFAAWTAVVSLAMLLMYIGTTAEWPGDYLFGLAFLFVGVVACLVVTLLPSRRSVRVPDRSEHPEGPTS